ncbi:ABC transporter [Geobacillus thermoleovorans]|uniref:ABC transporter ATP-binding protein n=1 Tax=Geobacillus thermoleovorans TaxID=33941 RepID=UPI000839F84D|nr:ABC transporter ATP-binding protein [Geobacillus thermoleovorans]ODA16268.1 ABC transporter [Geobacillus thermoleovorans]
MRIEVRQLEKRFGSFQAVDNVSFSIEQGQLVGLLGPSGGGKTSILRMLAGLEMPDRGEIFFDGKLVNPIPPQKRGIGFVFQHYALFPHMDVFENIAYGLRVQKRKKTVIHERVYELLHIVGLEGMEKKYPHQLSGGQKQRVALARALAPKPKLLLLDEPFSAIDAQVRKELRRWLRGLIEQLGMTTVFVTHDQEEAIELADQLIVVREGKVEQQGTPWDIYRNPVSPFIASFVGETNRWQGPVKLAGFPELDRFHGSLFIRPEWIHVRREGGPGHEKGMVKQIRYQGGGWQIEVELANGLHLLTFIQGDHHIFSLGQQVSIWIERALGFTDKEVRAFECASPKTVNAPALSSV